MTQSLDRISTHARHLTMVFTLASAYNKQIHESLRFHPIFLLLAVMADSVIQVMIHSISIDSIMFPLMPGPALNKQTKSRYQSTLQLLDDSAYCFCFMSLALLGVANKHDLHYNGVNIKLLIIRLLKEDATEPSGRKPGCSHLIDGRCKRRWRLATEGIVMRQCNRWQHPQQRAQDGSNSIRVASNGTRNKIGQVDFQVIIHLIVSSKLQTISPCTK